MEVPRIWRLKAQRYRMVGNVCPTCGQVFFPPRPICPDCNAQAAQVTGYELTELPVLKHIVNSVPAKG